MSNSTVSARTPKTTTIVAGSRGIVTVKGGQPTNNAMFLNNILATMAICGMVPKKKKVPA